MNFHSKFLVTSAKLPQHHSSNYRDLGIVIEWPKNSVRTGKDDNGKPWKCTMKWDYGYIPDVNGRDGESLDVYIGPNPESDKVYVVEQLKEDGETDEFKLMLGFDALDEAEEGYRAHYPDDWDRVGEVFEVPWDYAFEQIEKHQKTASLPLPKLRVDWPDAKTFLSDKESSERKVIPISLIVPFESPYGPAVENKVEKIKRTGRIPALVVVPSELFKGKYDLLDGHHRLEALKRLGYTEIPCLILHYKWPDDVAS